MLNTDLWWATQLWTANNRTGFPHDLHWRTATRHGNMLILFPFFSAHHLFVSSPGASDPWPRMQVIYKGAVFISVIKQAWSLFVASDHYSQINNNCQRIYTDAIFHPCIAKHETGVVREGIIDCWAIASLIVHCSYSNVINVHKPEEREHGCQSIWSPPWPVPKPLYLWLLKVSLH